VSGDSTAAGDLGDFGRRQQGSSRVDAPLIGYNIAHNQLLQRKQASQAVIASLATCASIAVTNILAIIFLVGNSGDFLGAPAIRGIRPSGAGAPLRSLPDYLPNRKNSVSLVLAY